jgi:hypothetical protein
VDLNACWRYISECGFPWCWVYVIKVQCCGLSGHQGHPYIQYVVNQKALRYSVLNCPENNVEIVLIEGRILSNLGRATEDTELLRPGLKQFRRSLGDLPMELSLL